MIELIEMAVGVFRLVLVLTLLGCGLLLFFVLLRFVRLYYNNNSIEDNKEKIGEDCF